MFEKNAVTCTPINKLLARRWSGRAFDPDRDIEKEVILSLLEAARWAPSCYGAEPWRFIVCDKKVSRQAWDDALACLSEGNKLWAVNAPLFIIAMADAIFEHNGQDNRWAEYDTGAACFSLCLQANEHGLMTHQMGGFDAGKLKKIFAIPDRYIPMSVAAIGYQLPVENIPAELMERESKERVRKPLGNNFYNGNWGNEFN